MSRESSIFSKLVGPGEAGKGIQLGVKKKKDAFNFAVIEKRV